MLSPLYRAGAETQSDFAKVTQGVGNQTWPIELPRQGLTTSPEQPEVGEGRSGLSVWKCQGDILPSQKDPGSGATVPTARQRAMARWTQTG